MATFVKSTLPNYLSHLPIPDTFTGWFKLGIKDWLRLIPPAAVVGGIGYMAYLAFCPNARPPCETGKCNASIRKGDEKVVDFVNVEDIADTAAFCRCWNTKNWPYCDGSHVKHNSSTGDNIGPLVVKKKTPSS